MPPTPARGRLWSPPPTSHKPPNPDKGRADHAPTTRATTAHARYMRSKNLRGEHTTASPPRTTERARRRAHSHTHKGCHSWTHTVYLKVAMFSHVLCPRIDPLFKYSVDKYNFSRLPCFSTYTVSIRTMKKSRVHRPHAFERCLSVRGRMCRSPPQPIAPTVVARERDDRGQDNEQMRHRGVQVSGSIAR